MATKIAVALIVREYQYDIRRTRLFRSNGAFFNVHGQHWQMRYEHEWNKYA